MAMGTWRGNDDGAPVRVSPKLDGVYARATKDGIFSKSGKPLDLPRVKARLKRHFRKHPDGALEGEIWKKDEGVEKIAGAVKSGGDAAKKLRLHVYPDQGARPWPVGAVRRVKGKTAKGEKDVKQALRKALKKGHEGVVVRRADGTREKLKPQQDAEWPVAAVKGGPRNVLVLRHADGGTFKVQGRPGVAAKEGDRVQVRYSGTTAKGRPKAAVAERIRNDNDFSTNIMNTTTNEFVSPARRILGAGHPCVRVSRLVELETPEDEIARDRRTLGRIAGGAAALGVTGALILKKGRLPAKVAAVPVKVPKAKVPKAKVMPAKAGAPLPSPAPPVKGRKKKVNLEEKRDRLSKVRDGAVIAGTGAVGVGSLVVAGQARKLRKQAGDAMGYAGSSISRAAKEVKREVTPERVAREGLRMVKKKAKQKAVEYFPTFTKAGRLLKKTVFETPAQRMGIEFATREQLRNKDTDVYANPLRVAAGVEKAYRPGPGRTKIEESLPIGNAQVIRAAVNKAEAINKWGTRGGRLAKDAVDVVRGKGRDRDASGRKKKREWEKSWAQNAAKKAVITAGVLGYATGLKKSPGFRAANVKIAGKIKKKVNEYVPDAFPERRFETPAGRLGITFLAKRENDARKDAAVGALAGGLNGSIAGGVAPVLGKEGTEWGKLNARQRAAEAAVGDEMAHGGSWKKKKAKGAFAKGKFGRGERLARAENVAAARLKKAVKRGALKGGLAGAAILGTAGYGLGKLAEPKSKAGSGKRKAFEAGMARVTEFDEVAEGAGWDIRDPRGRSARVFAPGSRKRNRREKRWHEKAENERKLWKGAVATAAVGGGAAGLILSKGAKNGPAGAAVAKLRKLRK